MFYATLFLYELLKLGSDLLIFDLILFATSQTEIFLQISILSLEGLNHGSEETRQDMSGLMNSYKYQNMITFHLVLTVVSGGYFVPSQHIAS